MNTLQYFQRLCQGYTAEILSLEVKICHFRRLKLSDFKKPFLTVCPYF
jgi:hypothetical protein